MAVSATVGTVTGAVPLPGVKLPSGVGLPAGVGNNALKDLAVGTKNVIEGVVDKVGGDKATEEINNQLEN